MAYTDPNTGKKAVLTYQSVSFQFQREQQYSRIYVYLLPDRLSSFMRLSDSAGKFTERINKLMTYRLICIAYKEEKAFFYTQSNIQSQDYADISLTGISNIDLDQKLNELGSRTIDLQQETGYFQFEIRINLYNGVTRISVSSRIRWSMPSFHASYSRSRYQQGGYTTPTAHAISQCMRQPTQ